MSWYYGYYGCSIIVGWFEFYWLLVYIGVVCYIVVLVVCNGIDLVWYVLVICSGDGIFLICGIMVDGLYIFW